MQPADPQCPLCHGARVLPNWKDAPGGPRCACGRKSVQGTRGPKHVSTCTLRHEPIPCPRCGDEALPVPRGLGADIGRPPFASADRPFCKCGWAVPGPCSADVRGEILSLRMQCPYCGEWLGSTAPRERDRFRVVGGTRTEDEEIKSLGNAGALIGAIHDELEATPKVERTLRLVKPEPTEDK